MLESIYAVIFYNYVFWLKKKEWRNWNGKGFITSDSPLPMNNNLFSMRSELFTSNDCKHALNIKKKTIRIIKHPISTIKNI